MISDDNSNMVGTDLHHGAHTNLIRADRVEGTSVYDMDGEKIGSIDSIMLTKDSGKVAYAIMSFGGFLGIGEKYHPLPWHLLDYDTEVEGYRISTAGAAMMDAPSFDRDAIDVPQTGTGGWRHDTDNYYGPDRG